MPSHRQPHLSEEWQYQVVGLLQTLASIEEYLDVFNFIGVRVQPNDNFVVKRLNSANEIDTILFKLWIDGYHANIIDDALCNNKSVEWIAMVLRKMLNRREVFHACLKDGYSFLMYVSFHKLGEGCIKGEFSKSAFYRYFPKTRYAQIFIVPEVFDMIHAPHGEPKIV